MTGLKLLSCPSTAVAVAGSITILSDETLIPLKAVIAVVLLTGGLTWKLAVKYTRYKTRLDSIEKKQKSLDRRKDPPAEG